MTRLLWLLAVLALGAGCASTSGATGDDDMQYGADADDNLKRGREALASKNFPDAARYFEFVKTKYPFLEAATQAELMLADTDYERDQFPEARDRYQNFVRLHPTHAKVDYAAFRAALTHYKDIPSDFFLLPPSEEKDQGEVKAALASMRAFLSGYPQSAYVNDAKVVVVEVKRRLADHELYVASFYARREKWKAVIARLQVVAKTYADVGYEAEVYFGLYDAHQQLGEPEKAKDALRILVEQFPKNPATAKARALLARPVSGAPPAAPTKPDAGS